MKDLCNFLTVNRFEHFMVQGQLRISPDNFINAIEMQRIIEYCRTSNLKIMFAAGTILIDE